MTIDLLKYLSRYRQKRNFILLSFLLILALATVDIDLIESSFKNYSFYISESFLFSSFWLIFFPLTNIQSNFNKRRLGFISDISIAIVFIIFHLTLFPALVWLLSKLFYYHTFSYLQTFQFALISNFFKAALIYTIPVFLLLLKEKREKVSSPIAAVTPRAESFISSIIVSDNYQKLSIKTEDVYYFSANPPYVNIFHPAKKYLHTATLRSLSAKLDNKKFVRIHKSYIVNIRFVASYRSRSNGDYDAVLKNGIGLRVSRHYAAAFKAAFENYHRHTPK